MHLLKRKCMGVATNVRKTQNKGLWILKIRAQELFTHRKCISTSRVRHMGWQPLIECVQCDFKIIYFSLFIFCLFYGGRQGAALAPTYPQVRWGIQTYVVLLSEKLCVLNWFYAFERFILTKNKKVTKALNLEMISSEFLMERSSFMSWFHFGFFY